MSEPATLSQVVKAVRALGPVDGRRCVIAIAGPPAAGKSTFAKRLCSKLAPHAAVLGLDAFHFDNAILEARGHLDRKGAPHTFDVAAYRYTLEFLRAHGNSEVSIPVFDRSLELTRNCAELVTPGHSIVITEGNYLLLDEKPWNQLDDLFDLTISVTADICKIEERILRRWSGFGFDEATARQRAEHNDLPNARQVIGHSKPAMMHVAQ